MDGEEHLKVYKGLREEVMMETISARHSELREKDVSEIPGGAPRPARRKEGVYQCTGGEGSRYTESPLWQSNGE